MPIYRYQCTECGAREEHLQKVSEPPRESCESCGGALSKLMTAAAFHLKGGGWYKDLYASNKSDAGGGESSAKSEATSSTATESSGSSSKPDSSKGSSSSSSPSSGSATSASTPAA